MRFFSKLFGRVKDFTERAIENLKNGGKAVKSIIKAFRKGYKGKGLLKGIKKGYQSAASTAKMLLRTQSTFAENYGKQQAAERYQRETGETVYKTWICTFYNSRDSHIHLHNTRIPIDDDFASFGGPMQYPGDGSRVGPEEICNCRCYIVIDKGR